MASLLGFHPPHFSEDAAWLPAWLQPSSTREESNHAFQCPSGQGFQELQCLQQSNSCRERGNFSDDDRCNSFRLFLSGQDNSSMDFPSCSNNHEVHYQLHLSLSEETNNSLNPTLSKSQAERCEFNQVLMVQQPPSKVIPEDDICEQRGNSGTLGREPVSFKVQNEIKPKVDFKSVDDISDAVELVVAASEALTILELVQNEPSTDLLTTLVILEAVMRVKQARLEDLKETLDSSVEENNEMDFLLDFDESMTSAYEDVGLTVMSHGDLNGYESISHVKDSYASESSMSRVKWKCDEPVGLEADSSYVSPQQQKDFNDANALLKRSPLLEYSEGRTCKEHIDHAELGTENADLACDTDPKLSCSVEQADLCTAEVSWQRNDFVNGERAPRQTNSRSSLCSGNPRYNGREDKMTNLVPDRFQSRWFGGWTTKNEASIPVVTNGEYKRVFADETSSLSESAFASDKNSCMQKHDNACNIVSQLSIEPGDTYENEKAKNNGNFPSEDVPVSPNVSPIDPLCSVVPCSFSTDGACHQIFVSQNSKLQENVEKHFDPKAGENLDILESVSPQNNEVLQEEGGCQLKINGESSPIIRRKVASLKTYSMLFPKSDLYLEKGHACGESLAFENTPNIFDFRDEDDDDHNQNAKGDTDLRSQMEKKTNLPMAINYGNTSGCVLTDVSGNGNLVQMVFPESNVKLPSSIISRKVESKCKNPLVPRRKRVRFSEAEIIYPQVKKFRKSKSRAHEVRHHVTAKKMLLQDLKFLLTGFSIKKHKQIKSVIQKNGGIVFDDIPSPPTFSRRAKYKCQILAVILCPGKLLTSKFLYGCAVNACILKVEWLFDSVNKGLILPPSKYNILKDHASEICNKIGKPVRRTYFIFDDIGVMLNGKPDFCSKMAKVIKHGGGLVFKSFHWLVKSLDSKKVSDGAIVVEDEYSVSRHLKQCALEQKVHVVPFSWIINSLYAGRRLPLPEHGHSSASLPSKPADHPDMSQEI